jgi:23S rRNA (guanine745-N1)-methyltransferase
MPPDRSAAPVPPAPPAPDDLRCPICASPLAAGERAFACASGHSFDRARQGYVNLLRPTRLRGDSAEMLRARRRFLDAGWYAPLADALAEMVGAWLAQESPAIPGAARALVDLGCGEGSYLRSLAQAQASTLAAQGWRLYGLDLSRDAIRMAAGRAALESRQPERQPADQPKSAVSPPSPPVAVTWVVASARDRLPVADAGVGVLLNIFAPRVAEEFARVVAPGGLLVVVTPLAEHLAEARAALPWLLSPQPDKDDRLRATLEDDFALVEARPVRFTLALAADALADLTTMTPHRAIASATLVEAAHAATSPSPDQRLGVRVACMARRYQRRLATRA